MRNVNVRTAKPEAKVCKLTEGKGMFLLVHTNVVTAIVGRFSG